MARPSRLYYGWVLLGVISFTEITSWGILYYTFPVFLAPMEQELGWSRVEMTGAFSLALLTSGLVALPVGRWLDRHGPRLLMTLGSLAASGLVGAWAVVNSRLAFYALWLGLGATMAAVLYEPAFVVVATWFRRYRSRALTVLTFAGGWASVLYVPLAGFLVQAVGWRAALLVLAGLLAGLTVLPHALLLRRRPADLGLVPDGAATESGDRSGAPRERSVPAHQALRGRTFWGLTVAFAGINFAASAISVHLIPYLSDQGYPAGVAAGMVGVIGLLALPGRLIFTPLGTRISRTAVTALLFALQAGAFAALVLVPGPGGVWGFVILFGAGFGALTPARAALVAEHYGAAQYGSINGMLGLGVTLARALAPVLAGLGTTGSGGYPLVFAGLGALSAAAILPLALTTEGRPAFLRRQRVPS